MVAQNRNTHKKKHKHRKRRNHLATFLCTLTGIVILGVVLIIGLKWNMNRKLYDSAETGEMDEAEEQAALEEFFRNREAIPEEFTAPVEPVPEVKDNEEIKEEEIAKSKYADQITDTAYLEANNIHVRSMNPEHENEVTLTFAGDILLDSEYSVAATLIQSGGNIETSIDPALLSIMRSSDIMMLNNEFPYSDGGTPTEGKQYTFRAATERVHYLDDMGVDIVSIANNHAYDYGQQAFLDTLDTLEKDEMPYVGGGRNIDEASRPVYFIIGDIKVGFLSATQIERTDSPDTKGATDSSPGVFRCWNNERLLKKIGEVKQNCDFLVVYIHWGTESTTEIDWAQQKQAPEMQQAGADLIIGDHPHILQPISAINGVPVFYSLGNFWFNSKEIDTCLVQATIGTDGIHSLKFIPALQSGCRTRLLTGGEASRVINEVQAMSPKVHIDGEGYISY